MTPELDPILQSRDPAAALAFFAGMPEARRRALAPQCIAHHRAVHRQDLVQDESGTFRRSPDLPCANIALLATASWSELAKVARHRLPTDPQILAILTDRRPPWTPRFATHLLEGRFYWSHWHLIRALVRSGQIEPPDHPHYILAMVGGLVRGSRRSILEELRDDQDLLHDEVWRIFDHEGGGENSLANVDRWGSNGWAAALLTLASEGRLDRERLLDRSLDALQRDFNHYRAKWFFEFFDALEPNADQLHARASRFLDLLALSAPNLVTWAFGKVSAVNRAQPYPAADLAQALSPVLRARSKALIKRALKLLTRAVRTAPDAAPIAAEVALVALEHPAADVQALALDLVLEHGTPQALADRLHPYAELIAPTLQARLHDWLPGDPEPEPPALAPDLSELPPSLQAALRLPELLGQDGTQEWSIPTAHPLPIASPPGAPLTPIADLHALVRLGAAALEGALTADELELFLDGVARLCDRQPHDFERRVGPLVKRLDKRIDPLATVVRAWCTGTEPRRARWHSSSEGLFARRCHRVATQAAERRAHRLLATPTHAGGFLDAAALRARESDSIEDHPEERALAHGRAWPRTAAEGSFRLLMGRDRYGRASLRTDVVERPGFPLVAWFTEPIHDGYGAARAFEGSELLNRWLATVAPSHRQAFFAAAIPALIDNLDWDDGSLWATRTVLEPLLEPHTPLGHMGTALLVVGLGAKEPGEQGLAIDAAITAIEDGRLGSDTLGPWLDALLDRPLKPGRVVSALDRIAAVSQAHAAVVLLSLPAAVARLLAKPPRTFNKLLELTEQLSTRLELDPPADLRTELAAMTGSSKAAKAARRLSALDFGPSSAMQRALSEAAALRAAAASHWWIQPNS